MMNDYLSRIEPEEVRFFMDVSEFKSIVLEMLGEARHIVQVEVSYEIVENPGTSPLIRPMIQLTEISRFTEEDRHKVLQSGFSIDREPFDNGDYAMEQIFGTEYTIAHAEEDDDGAFFTIEMPYRYYSALANP